MKDIPYTIPKYIVLAHRMYKKWLNTSTAEREIISGDPLNYFLSLAEMQLKVTKEQ